MGFEQPKPITLENELPLRLKESAPLGDQGRDTAIVKATVLDASRTEQLIALKQVRKELMASIEEMQKSKAFYDYLKSQPDFAKFVRDTLYFTARQQTGEAPQAYRLQMLVEGKRLDELSDEALYQDPELLKQLLAFTEAAIGVMKQANTDNKNSPDFYGDQLYARFFFDPRHSGNIMVANQPDANGNRIFLVDTNAQVQQTGTAAQSFQKHIGSKLQLMQLKRWQGVIKKRIDMAEG